jgi:hypothetical protein
MDATIEPARRIVARLLEADAQFFLRASLLRPTFSWTCRRLIIVQRMHDTLYCNLVFSV